MVTGDDGAVMALMALMSVAASVGPTCRATEGWLARVVCRLAAVTALIVKAVALPAACRKS